MFYSLTSTVILATGRPLALTLRTLLRVDGSDGAAAAAVAHGGEDAARRTRVGRESGRACISMQGEGR